MAELLIAQGKYDEAFEWMAKAIKVDPTAQEAMRTSADYDPVRADPRFQELIAGD
jgi:hypothetical protein